MEIVFFSNFLVRTNAKMLTLRHTTIFFSIQRAEAREGACGALARPGGAPRAADADAN